MIGIKDEIIKFHGNGAYKLFKYLYDKYDRLNKHLIMRDIIKDLNFNIELVKLCLEILQENKYISYNITNDSEYFGEYIGEPYLYYKMYNFYKTEKIYPVIKKYTDKGILPYKLNEDVEFLHEIEYSHISKNVIRIIIEKFDNSRISKVIQKYSKLGYTTGKMSTNKNFLKEINKEKIPYSKIAEICRLYNIPYKVSEIYDEDKIWSVVKKHNPTSFPVMKLLNNNIFLEECGYEYIDENQFRQILKNKEKYDIEKIATVVKEYVLNNPNTVYSTVSTLYKDLNFLKKIGNFYIPSKMPLEIMEKYIKEEKNVLPIKINESKETKLEVVNKENVENNDNISKEFVNTFFSNLEEPQKYIIEKLLEDKMLMNEKLKSIYKEFENKFIQLRDMTLSQIELSNKIKGGI